MLVKDDHPQEQLKEHEKARGGNVFILQYGYQQLKWR